MFNRGSITLGELQGKLTMLAKSIAIAASGAVASALRGHSLVKPLPRGGRLKNPGVLRTSMVNGRLVYRASLVHPTTKARSTAPKADKQRLPLSW
jgi:hypothetical protein